MIAWNPCLSLTLGLGAGSPHGDIGLIAGVSCVSHAENGQSISKFGHGGPRINSGGTRPGAGRPPVRILQPRPFGPRWYVLQLRPGHEHVAIREIAQGEARPGRRPRPEFQTVLPMQCAMHRVRGKLVEHQVPMFGGYGFVRFDARADDWRVLSGIDGVIRVMTTRSLTPMPLPDDGLVERLVDTAAERLHLDSKEREHRPVGSSVRLLDGALVDHRGVVLACDGRTTTASVSLLGRDVPVTMAWAAFEVVA